MKHDLKALRDLEKRLAEAKGGDRWWTSDEIDAWTAAIFGPKATFVDWGLLKAAFSSLDAAVALVGRVLPGWGWAVGKPLNNVGHWADLWSDEAKYYSYRERAHYDYCPTPALALCLACVRALIAQGEVAA